MRTAFTRTALAGAALAGGVVAIRLASRRRARAGDDSGRWHSITVFRPLDEVSRELPDGLTGHGGAWEVRLQAAPAGRGTEVHVRTTDPEAPDGEVRRALREGRSLLETGEVLRPGGPTTEPTLLNKPLRAATGRGRTGGLL